MNTFLIDPAGRNILPQAYDGQPHSLYTLFGSLLVDGSDALQKHMVYTATEAFERGETPYFLGEKLLFGPALVTGYEGFEECDALITAEALQSLIVYDIPSFYRDVLALLPKTFSFNETYRVQIGMQEERFAPEWVIYIFNMADEATKTYFLNQLETAVIQGNDVQAYFKTMAERAIRSAG